MKRDFASLNKPLPYILTPFASRWCSSPTGKRKTRRVKNTRREHEKPHQQAGALPFGVFQQALIPFTFDLLLTAGRGSSNK